MQNLRQITESSSSSTDLEKTTSDPPSNATTVTVSVVAEAASSPDSSSSSTTSANTMIKNSNVGNGIMKHVPDTVLNDELDHTNIENQITNEQQDYYGSSSYKMFKKILTYRILQQTLRLKRPLEEDQTSPSENRRKFRKRSYSLPNLLATRSNNISSEYDRSSSHYFMKPVNSSNHNEQRNRMARAKSRTKNSNVPPFTLNYNHDNICTIVYNSNNCDRVDDDNYDDYDDDFDDDFDDDDDDSDENYDSDGNRNVESFTYRENTEDNLLPPINLKYLEDLELSQVIRNAQLRHDLIFDPFLKFKPNQDQDQAQAPNDKSYLESQDQSKLYWNFIRVELALSANTSSLSPATHNTLVKKAQSSKLLFNLFETLKKILLTIVPEAKYVPTASSPFNNNNNSQEETHSIFTSIITDFDANLIVQELYLGVFDIPKFSTWITTLLRKCCAPIRDPLIGYIEQNFQSIFTNDDNNTVISISKFVDCLNQIFKILKLMKLDIVNYELRLFRPNLLLYTIDFEKNYFEKLYQFDSCQIMNSTLAWFQENLDNEKKRLILKNEVVEGDNANVSVIPQEKNQFYYRLFLKSVLNLLSCCNIVEKFPEGFFFDFDKLVLLRVDVRQMICQYICKMLYETMVRRDTHISPMDKTYLLSKKATNQVINGIDTIIKNKNGHCKWSNNINSISVQLCYWVQSYYKENINMSASSPSSSSMKLDGKMVEFCNNWLTRQFNPSSKIYTMLENKLLSALEEIIFEGSEINDDGEVNCKFLFSFGIDSPFSMSHRKSAFTNTLNISSGSSKINISNNIPNHPIRNYKHIDNKHPSYYSIKIDPENSILFSFR
ncbi:TCP11 family protein NDAI_0G01610 [Naumovozyma dairenensis CBS 421]|uniref:Uncharacterized protein n=1 Tax=Naumovozyma dairenensis (strain ATCC 10597 / BCRC 20456 / CBS 421 / NBRC 0211 / NRRL Y-12639) TaxID=1071378 RepID=G0WDS6_NAUDC|nr:hypothetical protein NDAI_0G01610 [Naumovozyma dairenensis CBS 421]CCD25937.2 hypothetical protein NDAI_0G01610 [Naumovozyma dairenensis CBS 421]